MTKGYVAGSLKPLLPVWSCAWWLLHRLPGERFNPACAPSKNASAKERTEEARNGILKATAHHPNAGEDQTAKTDDCTGMMRAANHSAFYLKNRWSKGWE